jgi:class 3 adenylate cyclase/tetratricopeptide (TPR) repeat protein
MTGVEQEAGAAAAAPARFDNPEAYIPGDRRLALAEGFEMPNRVRGAALFADISGFTTLTEALVEELGRQRGVEELTASLNDVFHALIAELHRYGGDVIYFSGDAVTCWIDEDDGTRATACALAMQSTIDRVGRLVTPAGSSVRVELKVAVAVGPARRFLVGDPGIQLIDVLAGHVIDTLAAAEHVAQRGEVVLTASAREALGDGVEIGEERLDEEGETYAVVERLSVPVDDAPLPLLDAPLDDDLVAEWLLPPVYERMRTGRGELLAELRPAIPVFVRFGGIDFDADGAVERLDEFVTQAQRVFADQGGNLLQLTVGDKGAYLYGVFGSPVAHEDDAVRAMTTALALRDLESQTAATGIQIGVAHGRLRSGTYGHDLRRTFVCLGDAVNLAARLMSAAGPGEIYVADGVRQAAGDGFAWEPRPSFTPKGKAEAVTPQALLGTTGRAPVREIRHRLPMFGRAEDLAHLVSRLDESVGGAGRIVGIAAEAGVGKSRLVAELVRTARRRGELVVVGECQAAGARTAYFAWREIWRMLFGLSDDDPEETQVARLEAELRAVDPGLVARAPLLEPVVGLTLQDNDLTASLDAKVRKTSLESLLVAFMRARAAHRPLVIVLEDCHWLDELSRDLLVEVCRAIPSERVLVVLAYRPRSDVGDSFGVETLPHFEERSLTLLGDDEIAHLITAKVGQILGSGTTPPEGLISLVARRAEGNPFYVEELVNYLAGTNVDLDDEAAVANVELPDSLYTLILSRIDTLSERPRSTLKVASVLGRSFRAAPLPEVYPDLGGSDDVAESLDVLRAVDLVSLDVEAEGSYLFRHVVAQEVAYESIPYAIRTSLHESTAQVIEREGPDAIELQLDLLAHHYWRSANDGKKRDYLGRAGSAARAAYANSAAIDYFERLATLEEGTSRAGVLLDLGEVLELTGAWGRAAEADEEALSLAAEAGDATIGARAETALAEVARKTGAFDEAQERLARARGVFEERGDDAGLGRVLHLTGTIAAQRGDYEVARERYLESLEVRERVGDRPGMASLLSNLGVVAEYEGDYAAARESHERALELRGEIGDRWAIGVSQTNLGMIASLQGSLDEARERFEESIRLNREVGDAWMVAIGLNNLGNAARDLGDLTDARAHYAASLRAYEAYDDRWALAHLLEDVGRLAAVAGDAVAAVRLDRAALSLREEIGAPRPPALEKELSAVFDGARISLGPDGETIATEAGEWTLEQAVACAHGVCRSENT